MYKLNEEYQMICVPKKLCSLQLDDASKVALLYLFSVSDKEIELFDFINQFGVKNDVIKELTKVGLIKITQASNKFYIDLNPFFESKDRCADVQLLDKVSLLLNRQIKPLELDFLNKWICDGFSDEEIQIAVQRSILNNVDNFNYINTVLQNSSKQSSSMSVDIDRNFDVY